MDSDVIDTSDCSVLRSWGVLERVGLFLRATTMLWKAAGRPICRRTETVPGTAR